MPASSNIRQISAAFTEATEIFFISNDLFISEGMEGVDASAGCKLRERDNNNMTNKHFLIALILCLHLNYIYVFRLMNHIRSASYFFMFGFQIYKLFFSMSLK